MSEQVFVSDDLMDVWLSFLPWVGEHCREKKKSMDEQYYVKIRKIKIQIIYS